MHIYPSPRQDPRRCRELAIRKAGYSLIRLASSLEGLIGDADEERQKIEVQIQEIARRILE